MAVILSGRIRIFFGVPIPVPFLGAKLLYEPVCFYSLSHMSNIFFLSILVYSSIMLQLFAQTFLSNAKYFHLILHVYCKLSPYAQVCPPNCLFIGLSECLSVFLFVDFPVHLFASYFPHMDRLSLFL